MIILIECEILIIYFEKKNQIQVIKLFENSQLLYLSALATHIDI